METSYPNESEINYASLVFDSKPILPERISRNLHTQPRKEKPSIYPPLPIAKRNEKIFKLPKYEKQTQTDKSKEEVVKRWLIMVLICSICIGTMINVAVWAKLFSSKAGQCSCPTEVKGRCELVNNRIVVDRNRLERYRYWSMHLPFETSRHVQNIFVKVHFCDDTTAIEVQVNGHNICDTVQGRYHSIHDSSFCCSFAKPQKINSIDVLQSSRHLQLPEICDMSIETD